MADYRPRNFYDTARAYVCDTLDQYEDCETSFDELAGLLMEGPYADGSLTYSRQEARDILFQYADDMVEINEAIKNSFGRLSDFDGDADPFGNAEGYHVHRMGFCVEEIARQAIEDCGLDTTGNSFILTEKVVADLQSAVEKRWGEDLF